MADVSLTNSDIQIIADEITSAGIPNILPIRSFAKNLNAPGTVQNDVVKVGVYAAHPDATAWNASSNNYETGDSVSVTFVDVTLSSRKKTTISIPDQDVGRVNIAEMAKNALNGLTKQFMEDTMALILTAAYGSPAFTGVASTFDSDDVSDLWSAAETANYGENRSLVIGTSYITNLLKDNDLKNYLNSNTDTVLKQAMLPNINGFDIIHSKIIPGNAENLVGFITDTNGIAVATSAVAPAYSTNEVSYIPIIDPESGLEIGTRFQYDKAAGAWKWTFELVYGASVADATKLDRLISAAP